jgi:hypothetical protein
MSDGWVSSEGKLLVTTWAGDFALPTLATKHIFPEVAPRYDGRAGCVPYRVDRAIYQSGTGNEYQEPVTISSN